MAAHVRGPLHAEWLGSEGPLAVLVHAVPLDSSAWALQMAHLSTWCRTMAVDLPGYGRSPGAEDGLTMDDVAQAVWEAVDATGGGATSRGTTGGGTTRGGATNGGARGAGDGEPVILMGMSTGARTVFHMAAQRPERTRALVLSGTGSFHGRSFAPQSDAYRARGAAHRFDHILESMSPEFSASEAGRHWARLFSERNRRLDVPTVLRIFTALEARIPEAAFDAVTMPRVVIGGGVDHSLPAAVAVAERLRCDLRVVPGAGHLCHIEQPWTFDGFLLDFLRGCGAVPAEAS